MFRNTSKRLILVHILIAVFIISLSTTAFADTDPGVNQLIKKFQDSDNPIDNSVINSKTNVLADNMETLDNALKTINSEPAVSSNYDKICPLLFKSNISGIKMFVDGRLIELAKYDNVNPVIIDGRVLVPLRAIVENLGSTVEWDEKTGTIKIKHINTVLQLAVGSQSAYVNGAEVTMDVPAQVINGRTLVPVRFIGESLSKTVEWHGFDDNLNVIAIY
jgi:Copper amine oxidase N-terminal domain.